MIPNPLALMLLGYFFSALLAKPLLEFLKNSHSTGKNYLGETIPLAAGLVFLSGSIIALVSAHFIWGPLPITALYLMVGLLGISFLGMLDDQLGSRQHSGLKGHIKALIKGQLTTGGIKAVGGGILGLFIALPFSNNGLEVILNGLLIALSINFINLLDLRPGRGIKGFIMAFSLVLIVGSIANLLWIFTVIGAVAAYGRYDFSGQAMMGDTGSNALGLTLGLAMMWGLGGGVKLIGLAVLVLIHVYAEYYSINQLIESKSLLRKLDLLGR